MLIKIFIHCQPGNDLAHRVSVHLPVLQHLSSLSKQYHCLTGLITACKCFNLVWLQIFILKYYIQGNIWPHFIFAPSPHCQWANLRLYLSINTSMFGWIQDGAKPFTCVEGQKTSPRLQYSVFDQTQAKRKYPILQTKFKSNVRYSTRLSRILFLQIISALTRLNPIFHYLHKLRCEN